MLAFLLPLASKIIKDAVNQIPENEELGEKMVEICLVILGKAVKLTKTEMDDQLLEVVTFAFVMPRFLAVAFLYSSHQNLNLHKLNKI